LAGNVATVDRPLIYVSLGVISSLVILRADRFDGTTLFLSGLLRGVAMADARFDQAITLIDQANGEDPRTELVDGQPQPKELLFSQRVSAWIGKLMDDPSEALLLAARGHTIRRWQIPRDTYSKDNLGYHEWRDALATFHAEETAAILRDVGYNDEMIPTVSALILRKNLPGDAAAHALEDADCLVFLETKLADYLDEWGDDKTINILRRTVKKMTAKGVGFVSQLDLDGRCLKLIEEATK
jgi:Domain of unknown function (DUF4202)